MEYILWLEQVNKDSLKLAGGKGANLGEMVGMRLPVPPGYVITTKAFDRFLEVNGIVEKIQEIIKQTNVEDTDQLLQASQQIKDMIINADFPIAMRNELVETYREISYSNQILTDKAIQLISAGREMALVAIRSSATAEDLPTASFAGQQATFLNVKGLREYLEAVKNAWASLYEPRAIFYRAKNNVESASIALVVQKMVNSEKSGVMFTTNPATGEDQVVIEATWGLGESLVSGAVEPDSYLISKDGKILDIKIGKKERMKVRDLATDKTVDLPVAENKVGAQVLTDEEALELTQYGLWIEAHYEKPQDIEFALERGKIYIVQTRPITTKVKEREEAEISGEPILKGLAASPGVATGVVRIIKNMKDITKVQQGDILVTKMTSPDLVPTMSKSGAIVTDEGGLTAHAAIVSREMGIPCIVGTKTATQVLEDGQRITVDAYKGFVYPGIVEVEQPLQEVSEISLEGLSDLDKIVTTQVKVNLVFADKVEQVAKKVDGVGLLRIEHMITKSGKHPAKLVKEGRAEEYIQILLDGIRPIAQAFNPKPVWVRTLDARSDEFRNLEGGESEPHEDNPMLGWHGIRRSLDEPELLKAEFEAIKKLHEEGFTNAHIMIPFVISVDEFKKAQEIGQEVGLPETVKMGIMVETPAATLTIEDFCEAGVDFVSFGTNDLTMLTLGIDRNNAKISHLYSELHHGVLRQMKHVINVCNKYGVESSVCGESGSNPVMAEKLVEFGIKSISANMDAIDKIRIAVIKSEKRLLLEALRKNE
jgi:pyruvate,water dikinase